MAAITELLHIIEILDEIHTEVQGMIKPHHLSTTLICDVLRYWYLYLNRCVTMLSLEDVGSLWKRRLSR